MSNINTENRYISSMYEDWFLEYASYVILERAVPKIEDGLKPVEIGRLFYGHLTNEEALEKLAQLKHALDFFRSFSGGNNGSK